jgi:hypothetical protein
VLASNATTILDYFRVLAWPVVAVGIAFMFREKVRELVARIREFSYPGGRATLGPPPRQDVSEEAEQYAEQLEDVANAAEEAIAGHFEEAQELREQLGRTEALLDLEQYWNRIYGSQVAVLRALDAAPRGLTRQALQPIRRWEASRSRTLL